MKTYLFQLIDGDRVLSERDILAMPGDVERVLSIFNFGCRKLYPHLSWRVA